jgi:hypothetical protein
VTTQRSSSNLFAAKTVTPRSLGDPLAGNPARPRSWSYSSARDHGHTMINELPVGAESGRITNVELPSRPRSRSHHARRVHHGRGFRKVHERSPQRFPVRGVWP